MKKSKTFGFDIYKNWHCNFPVNELSIDSSEGKILAVERRIQELAKRFNIKDKRILELGCLEGEHSLLLQQLGAREVIAIEGRKDSFLKCLLVKNSFILNKCKFLYGDINETLSVLKDPFDLCLAVGILYHLEDPVTVIYRIAALVDSIFAWTHYIPKAAEGSDYSKIIYRGYTYRGKYVKEDTRDYLSGIQKKSFLIYEEDLWKLLKDVGFKDIEMISKEDHEHGPAVTFFANKNKNGLF